MLQELRSISPFKVSMHVPMKSSSNFIYFHVFLQTSISGVQHENVQSYPEHAGGSRCTQTSTQPFSHMCWGHDAHQRSVRKSENTFNKETNPINQMQLSYWNPLFKAVWTSSGIWEQGKFPFVRLLNTKLTLQCLQSATLVCSVLDNQLPSNSRGKKCSVSRFRKIVLAPSCGSAA